MRRLGRRFFERYTPTVAKELLGCKLVRVAAGKRLSGIIVETEAYRGRGDPASHAFPGKTARNAVMFGEAGHAYVYFTMGMHCCLNVTTEARNVPGAVLFRAIEPAEGVEEMVRNRGLGESIHVADGPGKLTEALKIDRILNGEDFVRSETLFLESGRRPPKIGRSNRVGISRGTEREWRFYIKGNSFVSHGKPSRANPQNP